MLSITQARGNHKPHIPPLTDYAFHQVENETNKINAEKEIISCAPHISTFSRLVNPDKQSRTLANFPSLHFSKEVA
jgi:hypothetical protein